MPMHDPPICTLNLPNKNPEKVVLALIAAAYEALSIHIENNFDLNSIQGVNQLKKAQGLSMVYYELSQQE